MNTLWIAQAGMSEGDITLEVARALARAGRVILHTRRCGLAKYLNGEGIAFDALDELYERAEDFDAHARMAADEVLASDNAEVVYAVMSLSDVSVREILARAPHARVIGGGPWGELWARAEGPTVCMSASDWACDALAADTNALITEIDDRRLASEVKLKLMEHYPETSALTIVRSGGAVERVPLTELDRIGGYDHRFGCLAHAQRELTRLEQYDFKQLMRLVARLRDKRKGCAWDVQQDHSSLKRAAIEEAYELEDAIDSGDERAILEELGDILFICALHAQIALEHGEFSARDAITGVCQKMISRHPHVFGDISAKDEAALHGIWVDAKRREKHFETPNDAMRAVAKSLPALTRAAKIVKIARDYGEDNKCDLSIKLEDAPDAEARERAAGDMLMVCAKLCALNNIDPERALSDAVRRFTFAQAR